LASDSATTTATATATATETETRYALRILISLVLAVGVLSADGKPGLAEDNPCDPGTEQAEFWSTRHGCVEVPLDHSDPSGRVVPIYYELSVPASSGPGAILLFHGGPGFPRKHIQAEGALWRSIRSHRTVLYFHQRGAGWSGRVADARDIRGKERFYSLDAITQDAAWLHDKLLPGVPVVVMGKSAGGFLAMKYALSRPDAVSALVLAATSAHHGYVSNRKQEQSDFFDGLAQRYPGFDEDLEKGVWQIEPALSSGDGLHGLSDVSDLIEGVFLDLSYTLHGQFEIVAMTRELARGRTDLLRSRMNAGRQTLRSTGLESLAILNNITCREFQFGLNSPDSCTGQETASSYDLRADLERVIVPALVLGGKYDPILPPRYQEEIASALAGPVTVHILHASAHMLFQEQPAACAAYILDFLGIPRQQPAQTPAL